MAQIPTISSSFPSFSQFHLSNCTTVGAWLADDPRYVNLTTVVDLLRSLDPQDLANATNSDLLAWSESSWDDTFTREIFDFFYGYCHREICPFLQLEGDPDLAGIGMLVSYYFVATLATLYVIVFSLDHIKALKKYRAWKKLFHWFEGKLDKFLNTSLLFSISMLLAAIYRFISRLKHPDGVDENTFFYSLTNAIIVSIFTVFPPLILQFLERKQPTSKVIRAILWFLVAILATSLTALYYKWRGPHPISKYFDNDANTRDLVYDHWKQSLWLSFCDLNHRSLIRILDCVIIFAQGVLCFNVPHWMYLLFANRGAKPKHSNDAMNHAVGTPGSVMQRRLRVFNIILCCATMWLLIIAFTAISARVADGMPDSKDRKLSVGQVLAVATFMPLVFEMVGMDIGYETVDETGEAQKRKSTLGFS